MDRLLGIIGRYRSAFRFAAVGGLSFAIDYGLLLTTHYIVHVELVAATTIGFLSGLVVNFTLNKFWTFEPPHDARHSLKQLLLFGLLVSVNLAFTDLLVATAASLHVGPALAKPLATAITMCTNYLAYRQIIFKTHITPDELP